MNTDSVPWESALETCIDNRFLHLILLPTEACNFRCTYCYEQFQYGRMHPEVVSAIKSLLVRRAPSLGHLRLSWFGGEPLLARDIVRDLQRHAHSLSARWPDMKLSSDMSTNGYLLSPYILKELTDLGIIHYQVTFDGIGEEHDRKRMLANGHGTFDVVWGNLLASRNIDRRFRITARLHVDQSNIMNIPEFVTKFDEAFKEDSRYALFVRPLARLGGRNDAATVPAGEEQQSSLATFLEKRGHQLYRTPRGREPITVCYAAAGNSFVVRADGRLNKCTVALNDTVNQVGRLCEGGRVEIDPAKVSHWLRGLWSGERAELKCPR